jgi:hypothetical protein
MRKQLLCYGMMSPKAEADNCGIDEGENRYFGSPIGLPVGLPYEYQSKRPLNGNRYFSRVP